MAKKKNKTGLWLVLAALGGGAIWYFTRKPATAPATSPPATLPPTVTVPTTTSTTTMPIVPATLDMPATAATTSGGYPGDPAQGINAAQKAELLNLLPGQLSAANWQQFQNVMGQFTPQDWWGIYDLWGRWPNNGFSNMTPERIQFWTYWRTKYHIADGTYP